MKIANTIGKKLYLGFGAVLAILLILFVVSLTAILREREEQSESKAALADFQVINSVRDQITQNSLALSGYLLSGDSHEREAVNQGIGDLDDLFRNSQHGSSSQVLIDALDSLQKIQRDWTDQFAKPLVDKRQQVDAGNSTVSELQVFYLQKDPASWVNRSTAILAGANDAIRKALDDSSVSATRTAAGKILNRVMQIGFSNQAPFLSTTSKGFCPLANSSLTLNKFFI